MGKKRRLNRFISKWLKSDLPDDRSTVLLLGVTRIPTSPVAARRPCSLPLVPAVAGRLHRRNSSGAGKKGAIVRRNSSRKAAPADCRRHQVPSVDAVETPTPSSGRCSERSPTIRAATPPLRCVAVVSDASRFAAADAMERSVDSIGTCSLDVDASADLSDWSEISSAGTLRSSASFATPTFPEPHLPSYLSLACTINGYSTTTPYDPVRFAAKSRDASPHRIDTDLTTTTTYSAQNNLLSPPNLVPLPLKMEKALAQQHLHGEFYASMSTKKYISKETFTSSLFAGIGMDATDGCVDTGRRNAHTKCVSYESKTVTAVNGQSKCVSETSVGRQYENGQETKSFIQQRVERLYGPGALAQGFFKPQKKRVSEGEDKASSAELRIMSEDLEPAMRQSTSSPTLPVLRHLRPEFRAQLPFISPKKGVAEGAMQKSVTAPALKEKGKVNGCVATQLEGPKKEETNGLRVEAEIEHETERDGHYFLRVLDVQSKRLLELATKVENYMTTPNLSEEVIGILRAASGKGRLLVMQKMQQFKGLCTNNINRTEDEQYPTTNEDLQGFWDMVMLQVDQVDAIFRDVEALKVNGWKEVAAPAPELAAPSSASNPRRAAVRPRSAASEETRKQREAQRRKIIEDRRKAMKNAQQLQQKEKEPSIEIFAPNPAS